MILNLEFKNYRSFKGTCSFTTEPTSSKAKVENLCEVETKAEGNKKALKISLIFGANASGKTNIIKFLYGFRRWVLNLDNRVGEDIALYQPFKFDSATADAPIEFSMEFIAQRVRYKYEVCFSRLQIESESLISYPNGKQTLLYERALLPKDKESDTIKFGSSLSTSKPFNVFKNQLLISKFLKDTPCEPITNAAKYLADMVISNGFHEDTVLGEDKEILRWLYSRPDNKKMLAEFLAFADTGLADFQLEKRSGDVEVTSQHGLYKDGENIGKTDLPLKEESFGNLLFDVIVYYRVALARTGRSKHDGSAEGVDYIDPSVPFPALIDKLCRQVDGILILHEPCLLHEALIGRVEHIFHEIVLQHPAYPHAGHQQQDIPGCKCCRVQGGIDHRTERQVEHPPVHEKQHQSGKERGIYFLPCHLLVLYAFCTQAREGEEYDGKDLCYEQVAEKPCRPLEIQEYPVDYPDIDTHIHE